jgi:DNA segregation ATPase FtsK/SpoIIIE and related proteins
MSLFSLFKKKKENISNDLIVVEQVDEVLTDSIGFVEEEQKKDQLTLDSIDKSIIDFYISHFAEKELKEELSVDQFFIDYFQDSNSVGIDLSDRDPMFEEVARFIVIQQQGSTSAIQRKFSIGYNRAGRLMDQLENAGIVGATQGSMPREVFIQDEYQLE